MVILDKKTADLDIVGEILRYSNYAMSVIIKCAICRK